MTSEDTYVGQRIGNYRILRRLAGGGFGDVYFAEHVTLPRRAAVKVLHTRLAVSTEQRQAFLREANLLESLRHPYILPLYEVFDSDSGFVPCLIAEYAEGGSLRDRMKAGRLPLEEARAILRQVGQALQHAHQHNIVHRDLKPENILFRNKDAGEALLADFGIAVVLEHTYETKQGVKGTYAYMAPEQFHGEACAESDQYALGCLAYELCTGQRPLTADVYGKEPLAKLYAWSQSHINNSPLLPSWFNPQLPLREEMAILKALAKNRQARHVSVEAFISAFCSPESALFQSITLPEVWVLERHASVLKEGAERAREMYEHAASIAHRDAPIVGRTWDAYFEFVARRYEQALAVCQQSDAHTYSLLGDIWYGLKRYNEALAAYQTAIGLGCKDAEMHSVVGDMLYGLKQYGEALIRYQEAIVLGKEDARIYGAVGDIFMGDIPHKVFSSPRYEQALHAYAQAIRLAGSDSALSYRQGQILEHLQRDKEALASYEKVVGIDSGHLLAWYYRGMILLRLKRSAESLYSFDAVLRLDAQNVAALTGKAEALYALGHFVEAADCYEQVQRLDRRALLDWNNIGDTYACLTRFEEALNAYQHALQRNPQDARGHAGRGAALSHLQRREEALAAYEQAVRYDSRNVDALYGIGMIQTERERYMQAVKAYDQAIQLSPTFAAAYSGKGVALSRMKKYRDALAAYEQAIRYDATNASAHYGKANVLVGLRRDSEARSAYERALSYDREDISIVKGDALFWLKRYAEALAIYTRLSQLNPADCELYERCGVALTELGRISEARQMQRKARECRGYA